TDRTGTFRKTRGTASSGMLTERLTTQLWTMDEASEKWKPMVSAIYFYLSNATAVYNARFRPGEINHGLAGPILWWRQGRTKILFGSSPRNTTEAHVRQPKSGLVQDLMHTVSRRIASRRRSA